MAEQRVAAVDGEGRFFGLVAEQLAATIQAAIAASGVASVSVPDAAADRDRVTRLFASSGTRVAVKRRASHYDLFQELGGGIWWRMALDYDPTVNGTHHSMWQSDIGVPVFSIDQGAAAFAYSATGWTTSANANTYGGSYARNSTTGENVTFTSPAATVVGLRAFRTTNGGYAKVEIDGSATAATLLPTAQDEVNAGRLASSALVANGGTLNPTDRLYDSYGSTSDSDVFVLFAAGLPSAVHAVKLTVTGYKRAASTDVRLYVSGGIHSVPQTTPADSGAQVAPLAILLNNSSVYEYAITYKRAGGTLAPFIGNRHGNEVEDSLAVKVDGAAVTLADGQGMIGSVVQVDRTTHLLNPDNAAETVGNGALTWTITPTNGLDVHWRINWTQLGETATAYIGMLPSQGNLLDKGRACGGPTVTLLSDDGSKKGSTKSDSLVLWDSDGRAALMLTVRNLATAVDGWAHTTTLNTFIEDRAGADFNKGYVQRAQSPSTEVLDPGDIWESYLTYRAAWMTSTAPLES